MDPAIDWLNDNSGAVQALGSITPVVVTAVLVGVTGVYAWSTRRMAREMADTRRDSLRPIIGIRQLAAPNLFSTAGSKNYGVGPALDVWFLCLAGETGKENRIAVLPADFDGRALRRGEWTGGSWPLLVDQVSREAKVYYRDVLGDEWTTALKIKGFEGRARDEHETTKGWLAQAKLERG
jgi:hypothetical protein